MMIPSNPTVFILQNILYALFAGTGVYLILDILHSPISFVAIAAGIGTITPVAMTMLIGVIIAQIIRKILSKEWLDQNKALIGAGLMIGEAIAITFGLAFAIVINSIWVLPI